MSFYLPMGFLQPTIQYNTNILSTDSSQPFAVQIHLNLLHQWFCQITKMITEWLKLDFVWPPVLLECSAKDKGVVVYAHA